MNATEMNGWLHFGGGLELWHELYARFNLIAFPAGNTGVQIGRLVQQRNQLNRRSEGT